MARRYTIFAFRRGEHYYCEQCAAVLDNVAAVFQDDRLDKPTHCAGCDEFLENGLTTTGRAALERAIRNFEFELEPDRFQKYFECYGAGNWALIETFAGYMTANGSIVRDKYPF